MSRSAYYRIRIQSWKVSSHKHLDCCEIERKIKIGKDKYRIFWYKPVFNVTTVLAAITQMRTTRINVDRCHMNVKSYFEFFKTKKWKSFRGFENWWWNWDSNLKLGMFDVTGLASKIGFLAICESHAKCRIITSNLPDPEVKYVFHSKFVEDQENFK